MRTLLAASSILGALGALGAFGAFGAFGALGDDGRDLCARGARHHGAPIDLEVKSADLQDVFRLIADAGHVNIVVSGDVTGKVTLTLVKVAWEAAACAVAAAHRLAIAVDGDVLIVRPRN